MSTFVRFAATRVCTDQSLTNFVNLTLPCERGRRTINNTTSNMVGGGWFLLRDGRRRHINWGKIPMAGRLAFATWQLKLLPKKPGSTCTKSYPRTTNTNLTRTHTHRLFYINAHIYIYGILGNLGLIPRRGLAASTAQFRNFYGKSSLIKFNELWKRQQIYDNFLGKFALNPSRASSIQHRALSISWLIFLISRRQPSESRMRHRFGFGVVNWRMWFLWAGIIKCGIKSAQPLRIEV